MTVQVVEEGMAMRMTRVDRSVASIFIRVHIMEDSGCKFSNIQWMGCIAENTHWSMNMCLLFDRLWRNQSNVCAEMPVL